MTKFKKIEYKKDKYSGKIINPDVLLCNRDLSVIGKLFPIESPVISTKYNDFNEISFKYYKKSNGETNPFYSNVVDFAIVKIEDDYYEISVNDLENADNSYKNITGKSLSNSELSQKLVTLEINTENDIARDDYKPTMLCDPDNTSRSLIHRLLTYAPDYEVGSVDDSIKMVQITFSWSDAYMDSCLNDICNEIGCICKVQIYYDTITNKPIRKINLYDICRCEDCWNSFQISNEGIRTGDWWRNVVNGVCQTCGGTNIYEFGENTPIVVNSKKFIR